MGETVTVEHLAKTYPGSREPALDDVSLSVAPGTFCVLLGPSGSGKTTMLRCLAGIERISGGSIEIGGRTVADERTHTPPDRRDLSMVFQDYALWPHLTAAENVAFALRRRGLPRSRRAERAQAMLERVGLAGFAKRYPNELSGGQQQRVALARALIADTGLILCDEPLSNLDADLRERMRVEISSLVREADATTVYITHDQAEAFALADRVGVLENGALVQLGPPEEVYRYPVSPFVARFTGLAGELRVRVSDRSGGGTVTVTELPETTGGAEFPALRPSSTPAQTGDEAILAVRPTGVSIVPVTDPGRHLTGRVTDAAFRGRGYEHAIDVPGHGRIAGVYSPSRAARGDQVGLRLDPAGCHLFPAPDSNTNPNPSPERSEAPVPDPGASLREV